MKWLCALVCLCAVGVSAVSAQESELFIDYVSELISEREDDTAAAGSPGLYKQRAPTSA
jgi:hypothetical protein